MINDKTSFNKTNFRNVVPRFSMDARKANQGVVDLLTEMAREKKVTPAQIALAWLLAQKPWIVPIPGTTKLHRLEENIGSTAIKLTNDDLAKIGKTIADIDVQGERYPEQLQKLVGR